MYNATLCAVLVLFVLLILKIFFNSCDDDGEFKDPSSIGYATGAPKMLAGGKSSAENDYNDYLQNVALDPSIKEQHTEWIDNLMINHQPRMNSIRDDCDTGEVKRWGLLKIDYGNTINEDQHISVPSGRICTEGDNGNSRWGGYGIGMCPVQYK